MKKILSFVSKVTAHPLARGSAIVLIGTTGANVLSYAYHLVVGRMLGPVGYGELASLFSFSYLLNVPSVVIQTVLTKYHAGFRATGETGRSKTLSVAVTRQLLAIGLLGLVFVIPFMGTFAEFLHISSPVAILYMYLTSAVWLLVVVQASLLQGYQLFISAMILTNVTALFRLGSGYAGAMFGVDETVLAGMIAGILGYVIYLVPLGFVFRSRGVSFGIGRKELFRYSAPSFITLLGMTSLYSTDILLAKHFLPPVEAGYYAALSVMGKIIYFASSSVTYVLFPAVAERTKQKADSGSIVYMSLLFIGLVSGLITAAYYLIPSLALRLLFGTAFDAASGSLGPFGVFISLYSVCYAMTLVLLGRENLLVGLFVLAAAVLQAVLITFVHTGITAILSVNIIVMAGLLVCLLVYYRHAIQKD